MLLVLMRRKCSTRPYIWLLRSNSGRARVVGVLQTLHLLAKTARYILAIPHKCVRDHSIVHLAHLLQTDSHILSPCSSSWERQHRAFGTRFLLVLSISYIYKTCGTATEKKENNNNTIDDAEEQERSTFSKCAVGVILLG